jgi:hypothetical protein
MAEPYRRDHPPKWRQSPVMMRLHTGTGVIILWEPDCSSQVTTGITTSLESLKKDRDNGYPGPIGIHLWLWPFNYAYLLCPAIILCLFEAKAPVYTLKMAECFLCLFPWCFLGPVIHLLSLSFTMSLYLSYRDKWPWHGPDMAHKFRPWVQNFRFIIRHRYLPLAT